MEQEYRYDIWVDDEEDTVSFIFTNIQDAYIFLSTDLNCVSRHIKPLLYRWYYTGITTIDMIDYHIHSTTYSRLVFENSCILCNLTIDMIEDSPEITGVWTRMKPLCKNIIIDYIIEDTEIEKE